jgi:hypothetical protein
MFAVKVTGIEIDRPTEGGQETAPNLTVTGHVNGPFPDGSTITCQLFNPSSVTQPTATVSGISIGPAPDRRWSCQFTGVQPTAQGEQAAVFASLIGPDGKDISPFGPVLFTIL